eukprot:TRINITY_DN28587_c0_g1_i1.p1 TRINITY_DN28587_c0_g1~~TRINITY_DN28587_c0_g1_i1.p1  ORF type:complete len:172 (-),score=7.74 TRINITY_DN28587_c0_g1_i1:72-587(-)
MLREGSWPRSRPSTSIPDLYHAAARGSVPTDVGSCLLSFKPGRFSKLDCEGTPASNSKSSIANPPPVPGFTALEAVGSLKPEPSAHMAALPLAYLGRSRRTPKDVAKSTSKPPREAGPVQDPLDVALRAAHRQRTSLLHISSRAAPLPTVSSACSVSYTHLTLPTKRIMSL